MHGRFLWKAEHSSSIALTPYLTPQIATSYSKLSSVNYNLVYFLKLMAISLDKDLKSISQTK